MASTMLIQIVTTFPLYGQNSTQLLRLDNNDKCKTVKFNMKIKIDGCKEKIIKNNLCAGYCDSLILPSQGSEYQKLNKCSVCAPKHKYMTTITLNCEKINSSGRTEAFTLSKSVEIIKECGCRNCSMKSIKPK